MFIFERKWAHLPNAYHASVAHSQYAVPSYGTLSNQTHTAPPTASHPHFHHPYQKFGCISSAGPNSQPPFSKGPPPKQFKSTASSSPNELIRSSQNCEMTSNSRFGSFSGSGHLNSYGRKSDSSVQFGEPRRPKSDRDSAESSSSYKSEENSLGESRYTPLSHVTGSSSVDSSEMFSLCSQIGAQTQKLSAGSHFGVLDMTPSSSSMSHLNSFVYGSNYDLDLGQFNQKDSPFVYDNDVHSENSMNNINIMAGLDRCNGFKLTDQYLSGERDDKFDENNPIYNHIELLSLQMTEQALESSGK